MYSVVPYQFPLLFVHRKVNNFLCQINHSYLFLFAELPCTSRIVKKNCYRIRLLRSSLFCLKKGLVSSKNTSGRVTAKDLQPESRNIVCIAIILGIILSGVVDDKSFVPFVSGCEEFVYLQERSLVCIGGLLDRKANELAFHLFCHLRFPNCAS